MKPRYSIIIPVFNAVCTLENCIKSVLSQTEFDYEVLLIDDGSTDGSYEICLGYANDYRQIKVLQQKHSGVSSARNLGLNNAIGEYLVFIDSDDSIRPDFLEIMKSSSDLCLSGFCNSSSISFSPHNAIYNKTELNSVVPELVSNPFLLLSPWAKVFKKTIIEKNNMQFDTKLRLFEDTIFVLTYLSFCNSVQTIDYKGYYYNGKWGGNGKYILSLEEVHYRSKCEIDVISKLEDAFSCKIDKTFRGYCVDYLDDLYGKYDDRFCINFWSQYHPCIPLKVFLHSDYNYPSYKLISEIKENYKQKRYRQANLLLSKACRFFNEPISELRFKRKDEYILYSLLLRGNKTLAQVFLSLYYKIYRLLK